jgi:CRP-like cAMP-binding protein
VSSLLARLSPRAANLIRRYAGRATLCDGEPIADCVAFPSSGMVSIHVPGAQVEVGAVGHEGCIICGKSFAASAVARTKTTVVVVPNGAFREAMAEDAEIARMAFFSYRWILRQAQQIAVCNTTHSAPQRFARWLLRASDAVASNNVEVTQDTVAEGLGIQRTTASIIIREMTYLGFIRHSRGRLVVRDREALKTATCNCYDALAQSNWPSEILKSGMPAKAVDRGAAPLWQELGDLVEWPK